MKKILKPLSIAAAMLGLCAGLAACGQAGQTGQDAQTVSGLLRETTSSTEKE